MQNMDRSDTAPWDTAVELSRVTKIFTQRRIGEGGAFHNLFHRQVAEISALSQVSLSIRPGEFVAYAGPNGAGKSTTFKLLCGMLEPNAGQVRTLGMDPVGCRVELMRRLGVLFGNRTELWWDHPVRASFAWKRRVWEIDDARYEKQLKLAVELLDLEPLMNTFVRELSLGQRMRADLGLLLLHDPELILLDEPTLGLDVLAKRRMIDALKALNRDRGATILVTSHDLDDLTQMARRIVMLSGGVIAFDGAPLELYQLAGDLRTVGLIARGESPAIPGAKFIKRDGDRHVYSFDPRALPIGRLLREISALDGVEDVELGRAPIEEIIAGLYQRWKA